MNDGMAINIVKLYSKLAVDKFEQSKDLSEFVVKLAESKIDQHTATLLWFIISETNKRK